MKRKLLFTMLSLGLLLPCVVGAEQTSSNLDSVEEGSNSVDTQVTVGSVAVPTYEVSILWNDMTFDWVYNQELKKFEWKPSSLCYPAGISSLEELEEYGENIYLDEACTENAYEYAEETEYYVRSERESSGIMIEDLSQNGQITPSVKWTAEDKYSDVTAEFQYQKKSCTLINSQEIYDIAKDLKMYVDSNCSEALTAVPTYEAGKYYVYAYKNADLTTEVIPDDGRLSQAGGGSVGDLSFNIDDGGNVYELSMKLIGGSTTPTVGDKIGSLTIKITASE